MTTERRFCEFRAEGRRLSGTAIRYGSEARFAWGRERFSCRGVRAPRATC